MCIHEFILFIGLHDDDPTNGAAVPITATGKNVHANDETSDVKVLEQTYGIVPPMDFFNDPNHPPLEKTPKDDGYPRRDTWVESQMQTNREIIQQWQRKKAQQSLLGLGYESIIKYPILSEVDKCTFMEPANTVMKKLPPVERYAMETYIQELKDKELEAIQKAKMYRSRCEDLVVACKKVEIKSLKRELSIRQFWRNSVHEGSINTRGGQMVKLALSKRVGQF